MRNVMSGQSSNDDIYLFIMRHGEAEAPRLDDKSRQLTPLGREQAKTAALWLKDQYCEKGSVDLALVSPYRRAKQTHDMVSLDIVADKVESNEDIVPEGSPRLVSDYIDGLLHAAVNSKKPIKKLLVVSHMPLVSYLVDELCQSYTTSLFSTASIAVIKYSLREHKGTLVTHYQGL
ncbi:phosphohistidine phosphatase SixA [Alteromonas macleodii str. 'Black Sea 11']|jgi:phosphohistidine phosphatase|nr:phosphohistidine phosphatase SixA [Alteromonas macleodii str. 'Black Sea 11']MEC9061044.1 phosphohistidine phosphatase SixA [Pseudomonadota bacterium]NKW88164.1 phosphohistidine phosphatase SixA [Alteromonadaceae bacterium A_SAG4]NKX19870.1 phosphohistidine phosphatase SixA [Alteromonadaceae bacterium A_SAG8]NKX34741.1 phosphohistidine phosphatase SixA [Alteromonadaceae bacterium A_SAG3]